MCKKKTAFNKLTIPVETEIRGTSLLVTHQYDECTICHTPYEPLENRNKNILNEYAAYREKVGYLKPEEIRRIREKYKLNVRQFAAILGMNYQNLARIELGDLQNAYQNMLFVCAASPEIMYKWLRRRKEGLPIPISDSEKCISASKRRLKNK